MATEKRLIDAYALYKKFANDTPTITNGEQRYVATWRISDLIADAPTVDAVPIDEIKFLYMAIDKNGIPELKVQLGDRILCLRRENDPVDVVPVVRCKVCKWRNTRGCPYMNFNAAVRDDSDYCSDG